MPLSSRTRIADRSERVRSSMEARAEAHQLGSDSHEESSSFEAWVTGLRAPRPNAEESHASVSEQQEHTLRLHATLRRRARLLRGLLLVATIGLPLALVLHEIQAAAIGRGVTASSSLSRPFLSKERALGPWLTAQSGAGSVPGALDIQPASMDGDVVYACWIDSPSGPYQPAPLHLAVTADGAYTWRTLAAPIPRATACHLVPDASDARRIALVAQLETRTSTGCSMPRMYASEDGGTHWSAVTVPAALAGACALSLSSISGTLVLWTARPPTPTGETTDLRLWLRLDSEATWRAVGAGLPGGRIESVVSARADGALLVLVRRVEAASAITTQLPEAASELWSCPAGCSRWHEVARVPGSASAVVSISGGWQPSSNGWGALYAVDAAPSGSDSGSAQALTALAIGPLYASTEMEASAWHVLPPPLRLAVESSVSAEPATAPGRIMGVGPDGSLVLESRNAAVTSDSSASMQAELVSMLSLWEPSTGRWLAPVLDEPAATTALAAVWDEQGANGSLRLTIWLVTRSGYVWPVVVPSSFSQVLAPVHRCQRCG